MKKIIISTLIIILLNYTIVGLTTKNSNEKEAKKYYAKGNSLLNKNRYSESIKYFDKAIELDTDYNEPLLKKGIALSFFGNYDEALECYDKILKIDNFHLEIKHSKNIYLETLNEKSYILYHKELFDEAIYFSDLVLEKDNKNIRAITNKVAALLKLEKYNDTNEYLDLLIKIDKTNKKNYLELKANIEKFLS